MFESAILSLAIAGVGLGASAITIIQFVWGFSNWTEITFSRGFVAKPIHIDRTLNFFDKGQYQARDISAKTFNTLAGTEYDDGSFFIGISREGLPKRNYLSIFRFHQGHLTKVRIYRIEKEPGMWDRWTYLEQVGVFANFGRQDLLVNLFTKIARPLSLSPGEEGRFRIYSVSSLEVNEDRLKIYYNKDFDYIRLDGKKIEEYGDEYIEIRIGSDLSAEYLSSS